MKRFFLAIVLLLSLTFVFGEASSPIVMNPLYYTTDGQKALPINCDHIIDVERSLEKQPENNDNTLSSSVASFPFSDIKELHLVIGYNPADISITKLLQRTPTKDTRYRVENDHILFTQKYKTRQPSLSEALFSLGFLVNGQTTGTTFTIIAADSYSIDTQGNKTQLNQVDNSIILTFAPETDCAPDIISPAVSCEDPLTDSANNKVNSPVRIKITDAGAGVDRSTLDVRMDGLRYVIDDEMVSVNGDILTIDPVLDFLYGTSVYLTISIKDTAKQPNLTKKTCKFTTTTNTPMCQKLGCTISLGRQISRKECLQFQKMYMASDVIGKRVIKTMFEDLALSCSFAPEDLKQVDAALYTKTKQDQRAATARKVSFDLFSMFGRVIAIILLMLVWRYKRDYKKTRKKLQSVNNI